MSLHRRRLQLGSWQEISNDDLLALEVDFLVPAALENVLHAGNADAVKAKVVLEMANGPSTPDADAVFKQRHYPHSGCFGQCGRCYRLVL